MSPLLDYSCILLLLMSDSNPHFQTSPCFLPNEESDNLNTVTSIEQAVQEIQNSVLQHEIEHGKAIPTAEEVLAVEYHFCQTPTTDTNQSEKSTAPNDKNTKNVPK